MTNHETTHVPNGLETGIGVLVNLVFGLFVGGHENNVYKDQPIKGVLITGDGTQLPISTGSSQETHHSTR